MTTHLLFSVDHVRCALPLSAVRIVLQMVQLGPAPEPCPGIAGTLNFHGQIIPVWSVRSFFGIPDRPPMLSDRLIIAEAGGGTAALWVDETHVIQQSPVPQAPAESLAIKKTLADGVDLASDDTVLFSDLFRYLEQEMMPVPGPAGRTPLPRRTGRPREGT